MAISLFMAGQVQMLRNSQALGVEPPYKLVLQQQELGTFGE